MLGFDVNGQIDWKKLFPAVDPVDMKRQADQDAHQGLPDVPGTEKRDGLTRRPQAFARNSGELKLK